MTGRPPVVAELMRTHDSDHNHPDHDNDDDNDDNNENGNGQSRTAFQFGPRLTRMIMMITAIKHDTDDDNNDAKNDDNDDGNNDAKNDDNNDGNGQNGAAFQCAVQRAQVLAGSLADYSDAHGCTVQALYSAPELAGCWGQWPHFHLRLYAQPASSLSSSSSTSPASSPSPSSSSSTTTTLPLSTPTVGPNAQLTISAYWKCKYCSHLKYQFQIYVNVLI